MGRKAVKMSKLDLYLVEAGRIFPLFPQSFQHSTPEIHTGCGKEPRTPRFHIPSTLHSQSGGKPNPGMKPKLFRLFNIFPTPYYDYYNKFNIDQAVLHPIPWADDLKN